MIDFIEKRFCAFGLQESGKTHGIKHILKAFGSHAWVIDTNNEYQGFNRYLMQNKQPTKEGVDEFNKALTLILETKKPLLIVIDEANTWIPKHGPIPPALTILNDRNRHTAGKGGIGCAVGFICRRPTQLYTDLVELCQYIFCFKQTGKNTVRYLNDIAEGFGDAVKTLDFEEHHFIYFNTMSQEPKTMVFPEEEL